jgi:hypothetical protein
VASVLLSLQVSKHELNCFIIIIIIIVMEVMEKGDGDESWCAALSTL